MSERFESRTGELLARREMIVIRSNTKLKFVATAAACAVVGAVAGIAAAGASPSTHTTSTSSTTTKRGVWPGPGPRGAPGFRGGAPGPIGFAGGLGPAVHETAVVLNQAGTGYITVTEDSGTVQSVSGDRLIVKEAIGKVTYRTVTLTIPSNATVYRNFAKSSLSSLKSGDRVRVVQSSEGTDVVAVDASATGPGRWRGKQFLPGRHAGPFVPGGRASAPVPAQPGGSAAPGGPPIA